MKRKARARMDSKNGAILINILSYCSIARVRKKQSSFTFSPILTGIHTIYW
jgi:hypothetical protein